jgi:hypothetical protein
MFRRSLCMGLLLLLLSVRSDAQATLDSYTNRLFFNLFTEKPDTVISSFLNLYVPVLNTNKMPGKWISYPASDTIRAHEEMHSFIFRKHPFFSEKFTIGHIDFFCKRYEGTPVRQNITGIQLWFEFDVPQEAEIAFSRLVEMFILLSTDKKINTVNGTVKAAFINTGNKTGFSRVQVSMMADNSVHKYKVLFEAGNSL